jgi:alanyl-tRNA synthetase
MKREKASLLRLRRRTVKSSELREKYLAFFEEKGCKRLPSSSLIPDDPSLLLTSAGMVQFKPYFLQQKQLEKPYIGTTTVQKCVRTTDIDIIGTTGRHLSFFEMLGNFSFGAYFKQEMCTWAYEFSTEVLNFDPERLYFTVYLDDDETVEIWKSLGVPESHITRLGAEDNFWMAGPTGPCGPCSELYYDQGLAFGCGSPDCAPGCDCDRFLEYWNCVFTQYDRQEDGTLVPLPNKNIDTGMGLERTAAILQGVQSNYETDILRGLIAVGERLSGKVYGSGGRGFGKSEDDRANSGVSDGVVSDSNARGSAKNGGTGQDVANDDLSLRICADHARAVTFMIADGILPSNEGRGYVLRRLLRRAARHGQLLGIKPPFFEQYVTAVIDEMAGPYPELRENQHLIERIIRAEEERFNQTLRAGQTYLAAHLASIRRSHATAQQPEGAEGAFAAANAASVPDEAAVAGETSVSDAAASSPRNCADATALPTLSGKIAFELHDRYGFPIDLTVEIAAEHGIAVDREGFELHMTSQRERARAAAKDEAWSSGSVFDDILSAQGPTTFVGYTVHEATATVVALVIAARDEGDEGGEGDVGSREDAFVTDHLDNASAPDFASREGAGRFITVDRITSGQHAQVVLDRTPFYGEMGGQVGDVGFITTDAGDFHVEDTKVHEKTIYAHSGVIDGTLAVGDTVIARIDSMRRERVERNHTATHLLHFALRTILGEHVKQAGSLVAPDRLRFDFTHFEALTSKQINQIEELANHLIMEDSSVSAYETSLDEARANGVTALFGEKYGERVRVLEAGADSRELCGGTHVTHTAQIGFLKIVSESSVGANLRRVEAVTSFDALQYVNRIQAELTRVALALKAQPVEVADRIDALQKHVQDLEDELKQRRLASAIDDIDALVDGAADVGYRLVIARFDGHAVEGLRGIWDMLRGRLGDSTAVVLGGLTPAGTPLLLAAGTPAAAAAGFDAAALVKRIAPLIKGGGGGKPTMAQAGGKDPAALDAALDAARAQLIF